MNMNGYNPTPKDIQIVLKHLKNVKPDATEEDALHVLLKSKIDIREKSKTSSPDELNQEIDKLILEIYGQN